MTRRSLRQRHSVHSAPILQKVWFGRALHHCGQKASRIEHIVAEKNGFCSIIQPSSEPNVSQNCVI